MATEPMATETSDYWTVTPWTGAPASIVGWRTYIDATYRFRAVIPPGWRLETLLYQRSDVGGDCSYNAIYFPPGDTRHAEPLVWIGMYEYMMITVTLNCPTPSAGEDQYLTPIGPVTISGAATTLYGQDSNQEVSRVAYTQFGGHPYTFVLIGESNQHTATTADVPLYLGVLSGFRYLGN